MTDIQLSIFLKNQAERLQNLCDAIQAELPPELSKKRTVETLAIAKMFNKNLPDSQEITEYPILFGLENYISELEADAERLQNSAVKRKRLVD